MSDSRLTEFQRHFVAQVEALLERQAGSGVRWESVEVDPYTYGQVVTSEFRRGKLITTVLGLRLISNPALGVGKMRLVATATADGFNATEALKAGAMINMHGQGGGGGGPGRPPIPPAIPPDVWAQILDRGEAKHIVELMQAEAGFYGIPIVGMIAIVNHSLPDSDPRKITREKIEHIRAMSQAVGAEGLIAHRESDPDLDAISDALESYLPPA